MSDKEDQVRTVRVVLASPGDVAKERAAAKPAIEELNRGICKERGCRIELWRWEIDARPGVHLKGPQGIVDEEMDLEHVDVVVGVFWKRFGTPTAGADSGTEHELRRAWKLFAEQGRPDVMLYFCTRALRRSDDLVQAQRVREFHDALPMEQFSREYGSVATFEDGLREHLTRWVQSHVTAPTDSPRRVRFNLPRVAAAFAGRDGELERVHEALSREGASPVTLVITGLGGVGKSQLAARYAQTHLPHYETVAWINAERDGVADLAKLGVALGAALDGVAPARQAEAALDWLSTSDKGWLLVLDNIDTAEQLERLLPRCGVGRVLVTARDQSLGQFGETLALEVLADDAATAFLMDRAGKPGEELAARRLASALGHLPLALSHAAAYCASATSFDEYLELLDDLPARELFDSHPEVSYAKTVASTWRPSFEAARAKAPMAARLLLTAAHLAPDPIPRSVFEAFIDLDDPRQRKKLGDALNALARLSLATVERDTVTVHRLLQKVIRDDQAASDDDSGARLALASVDRAFPSNVQLPAGWTLCEQLLWHAVAVAVFLPEPGADGAPLIGLLNRASHYLIWAEPGGRDLWFSMITLRSAERVLNGDHPQLLTARSRVAFGYMQRECFEEAATMFDALVADRTRILGAEHPETLVARSNLARVHGETGRTDKAVAMLESLLADSRVILGKHDAMVLNTRQVLASAYRAAARPQDAIAMLEQLVDDDARAFGDDHPETLSARRSLALSYVEVDRNDDAIDVLESLVVDNERVLGLCHGETFMAAENLMEACRAAGRTERLIALLEQRVTHLELLAGRDDSETLMARNDLAIACLSAGRAAEGIAVLELLLADCERVLGAEHAGTQAVRTSLANANRAPSA